VDFIADLEQRLIPFEVKYRSSQRTGMSELKGLAEFCAERQVERAYVVTRDMSDFRVMEIGSGAGKTSVLKIPAPLACYWLGRSELEAMS
jgi:hypothetical protein